MHTRSRPEARLGGLLVAGARSWSRGCGDGDKDGDGDGDEDRDRDGDGDAGRYLPATDRGKVWRRRGG